ncbi:MAG: hypothetical protein LBQ60_12325 [Bacteroidales bacterium]|jgi:hypothetical protein|nr:hypothetical protein [Bacteroidales bacterium]
MDNENIYRKIQDFFGNLQDNFSLLEEPVDVNTQMKYFEASGKLRGSIKEEDILARKEDLLNPDIPTSEKETLLVQMAGIPNPEIFRTIEAYVKNPDESLKEWAQLALQENKLLLESHLLDRRQVFISTGLGGKGHKLRYFVVLINKEGGDLQPFQQKIVHDEMEYALNRYNSELEKLNFLVNYTTMRVVVPITSDLTKLFREGIEECNQFGNFLSDDFIVTNMKELDAGEIKEALEARENNMEIESEDDDFPPID